jgi:excisionase family DNA binding protein
MTERRCLTPEEFACERRISVRTVYRLIDRKDIPAERVGRQWRIWVTRSTRHNTTEPPEQIQTP